MQNGFSNYLQREGLAQSSIAEHEKNLLRFEEWISASKKSSIAEINYTDLLEYVHYLKEHLLSVGTINIRLNSLRKYYELLKEEKLVEVNPARHLHIKGRIKKVVTGALSTSDFDTLYAAYSAPKACYREAKHRRAHQRDIVILGLLLWQGVESKELGRLERNHVNLKAGTIYIPSTGRSNSRELRLDSRQIMVLQEYLQEIKTEKLFECNPYDTMQAILKQLKSINPQVRNAAHLRASVILEWLKRYNKREVQYMAGHRHISSTEYYEVQELSGLTAQLSKHHPFR
jgi:site-specific recombinase XerD